MNSTCPLTPSSGLQELRFSVSSLHISFTNSSCTYREFVILTGFHCYCDFWPICTAPLRHCLTLIEDMLKQDSASCIVAQRPWHVTSSKRLTRGSCELNSPHAPNILSPAIIRSVLILGPGLSWLVSWLSLWIYIKSASSTEGILWRQFELKTKLP